MLELPDHFSSPSPPKKKKSWAGDARLGPGDKIMPYEAFATNATEFRRLDQLPVQLKLESDINVDELAKQDGHLHEFMTPDANDHVKEMAKVLQDTKLLTRIEGGADLIAKYHFS